MTQPTSKNSYADVARDLTEAASRLATLHDRDLPPITSLTVYLQAARGASNEEIVATIDAIGIALNGTPGKRREISSDTVHHRATAQIGRIEVLAFMELTDPRDARIAELEAELARRPTEPEPSVFPAATPRPQPAGGDDPVDVATLPPLVEPAPITDPALLNPETDLDTLPADFGADHDPTSCRCDDCDAELLADLAKPAAGGTR